MSLRSRIVNWIAHRLAVSIRIDDSPGWTPLNSTLRDRDANELITLQQDALEAWRKNPIAWRTIAITTDYVVGEEITISSANADMQRYITQFWNHPKNNMQHRLESMCDELSRSGDIFPLLFLNRQDGMSYIRFLTKEEISDIETAAGDWETETVICQYDGLAKRNWYTPHDGRSKRARAIALHYSINKPIGATYGESDLTTIIPWLQRYSRMLDGRIRLHWAARAFLWFVTVPTHMVKAKEEQYREPPEPGSVVVKDPNEVWEMLTPNMRGSDAAPDLKATRTMIDAGTGFPPHWRGEGEDVNHATATAMQEPTERHLTRRQNYFVFILMDLLYHAYQRAHLAQPDLWPAVEETDYAQLFTSATPDVSKADNESLSLAAMQFAQALEKLDVQYGRSPTWRRLALHLALRFAGEPQSDKVVNQIVTEAEEQWEGDEATEGTEDTENGEVNEPTNEPANPPANQNGHQEPVR